MFKIILFSAIGIFLFTQVCTTDHTDDDKTEDILEPAILSKKVNVVALSTKESGVRILKEKTEELIIQLRKVKSSTPSKITNCHQTLNRLLKEATVDLETCVNKHAEEAISLIYDKSSDLADKSLFSLYDKDGEIVDCEKTDADCVDVVAEIKHKTLGVPEVISDEIKLDRRAIEKQIEFIKACVTQAMKKAEKFARNCVL